jgi:hypothetical protein
LSTRSSFESKDDKPVADNSPTSRAEFQKLKICTHMQFPGVMLRYRDKYTLTVKLLLLLLFLFSSSSSFSL